VSPPPIPPSFHIRRRLQRLTRPLLAWLPLVAGAATSLIILISVSCRSANPAPNATAPASRPIATTASTGPTATLEVTVQGLESTKGQLIYYVYDSPEGYLKDDRHIVAQLEVQDPTLTPSARFTLPPGRYAVVVIHDLNKNGDLDTNVLGIPTEPWGVSQGARPRFRAPTFEESVVDCPAGLTPVPVAVR
jgi:uncharacterized protein (DUF2141 family)